MQDPENPEVADVYGHYGFAVFWTVPAVGDVLNRLSGLGGFGSVRVLSRHFFLHERVERSWWVLMVEEVQEDPRLAALNAEIVQSFDEDEAARHQPTVVFVDDDNRVRELRPEVVSV